MESKVLSIILGGGKGTRLYPLTKERAKPAVPFGGKYRLVDIPLSNSINSGFKNIYVLTQFNTASLHMHIVNTYIFDAFSKGFVEILAAEQTFERSSWYEGTADAVRKNFFHFNTHSPTHYIILSGDQLYRMDLEEMFKLHMESGAAATVATTTVKKEETPGFGILKVDNKGHITDFLEKPPLDSDTGPYKIPSSIHPNKVAQAGGKEYLASMGIYIFNASALEEALDNSFTDFGKEIIPQCIEKMQVNAYIYNGFWEDIGTIRNYYDTSLSLTSLNPEFNFYDEANPIYTHKRYLPATKINFCTISQSLAAEGSIITNASLVNSLIGIRTIIESGANLDGVVCMGASYYEDDLDKEENRRRGRPNIGIGRGTMAKRAIIDMNARIGDGCRIGMEQTERQDGDYGNYHIIDGVIVIPKGAVIPNGTSI